MIKVDDLITWARNNAYGRSASLPCGWIMSEQLQSLAYEMKKVDPLNYDPKVKAEQTEPRRGEWVQTSNDWIDGTCGARYFPIRCSVCGYSTYDDSATNFCPNCGADMRR